MHQPGAVPAPVTELSSQPWTRSWEEVLQKLDVCAETGLGDEEVARRKAQFGENRLQEKKPKSAWPLLIEQFQSLLVLLLAVAAALSLSFGEWVDAAAISVVIVANAGIGFLMELKAYRSMEALHRLGMVTAKVRRHAHLLQIPAVELVPGDIVALEGGDVVPADIRLLQASKLQADESALTGESFPTDKSNQTLPQKTHPAERTNMLFRGTALTRGSGLGVVVATGMQTDLGQIAWLAQTAEVERTPLEKRLAQLGHKLIWVTLGISVVVALAGLATGKPLLLMIQTSVALAVATIPEGLPIVTNIALAQGMWRMARRNALINRLSAVETLGSTTVICSDKTGTLTENQMTVTRVIVDSGEIGVGDGAPEEARLFTQGEGGMDPSNAPDLLGLLRAGLLCNNASVRQTESGSELAVGDPLEVALLVVASKAGLQRERLVQALPEVREEAFDPEVRLMAKFHRQAGQCLVAVKGAPEAVLQASRSLSSGKGFRPLANEDRRRWLAQSERLAGEGLRVLALAEKVVPSPECAPYEELTFLGLVGIQDPPRQDVRPAILSCQEAGIRVVMVTGDQPATGRHIAWAVGLTDDPKAVVVHGNELQDLTELSEQERARMLRAAIFARLTPKQKLDLIALHQSSGSVVAMTGDGVNDAPALRKADIGIAMGVRGTQVASQAADMVLRDDAFSTIVEAISQGRVIFGNIRKFVLYLLSCNVSEVLVVGLASLVNAPLPILPLQILFLNLVTDVFPALAIGAGPGEPAVMKRPPRDPQEPILTRHHWRVTGGFGLLLTACTLGAFSTALLHLRMETPRAITVSFLTLALAQLFHVFNMRDSGSKLLRNEITQNPFIWGALATCLGLLLAALHLPGLASVLNLHDPGTQGWILIVVMSLLPTVIGQTAISLGLLKNLA